MTASTVVTLWSGAEVRALRQARRMSLRDFAEHLGVSDRMVSKWEAGRERIHPRPVNQAALDESLRRAGPAVHELFAAMLRGTAEGVPASEETQQIGSRRHDRFRIGSVWPAPSRGG